MHDLHCHVGFSADPITFAQLIEQSGMGVLSATVTPEEFKRTESPLAEAPAVRVAAGLHPWWVPADLDQAAKAADTLMKLLPRTRFVGEIGLDFSPAHNASREAQLASFERIVRACAEQGGKVITFHSVRAATELLDLLERTDCVQTCSCILHWFSGSSDELDRARDMGCFFSVGTRMLATKRGHDYVRKIPRGRLTLETDLPAQRNADQASETTQRASAREEFEAMRASLNEALEGVLACSDAHSATSIEEASRSLLERAKA